MVKYKLIKKYPGSPELGTIEEVEHCFKNLMMGSNGKYLYNISESPEFWELVIEKDYEILSFIVNQDKNALRKGEIVNKQCPRDDFRGSRITAGNTEGLLELSHWSIHSVKRLSDSEIFTIGDKVFNECVNYTINKIGIVNDKCMVSALYDTNNPNGSRLHYNLNNLKKVKQKLFTTEDDVDIFENNTSIYHVDKSLNIKFIKHKDFKVISKNVKYFSTKEKAEEYIIMNKPCLSLSDVWDNLKVKDQKEVMKFVKSKLNK